jgi:hypothetical protein
LRKNVKLKLIGVKLKISSNSGKRARLKKGKEKNVVYSKNTIRATYQFPSII